MKKILLASSLALFFVACGSTTTKTIEQAPQLVKDAAVAVPAGYQVKPLGGAASFRVHVNGGKNYVTLVSGDAVLEKVAK